MTLQVYDLASGVYAVAKRSWNPSPTSKEYKSSEK